MEPGKVEWAFIFATLGWERLRYQRTRPPWAASLLHHSLSNLFGTPWKSSPNARFATAGADTKLADGDLIRRNPRNDITTND